LDGDANTPPKPEFCPEGRGFNRNSVLIKNEIFVSSCFHVDEDLGILSFVFLAKQKSSSKDVEKEEWRSMIENTLLLLFNIKQLYIV